MESHGIEIYPERDSNFTEDGLNLLKKFYASDKGETAQVALARTMNNFCYGDKDLAQRLYEAASKQWWFPSSPPLSNAVDGEWDAEVVKQPDFWKPENRQLRKQSWTGAAPKTMPISCFLTYLGDSIKSQMKASSEIKLLSVMGGGTSLQSRIRATTDVAPGPIPFLKTVDGDMGYWRQGKNRRGSCAVYLDVDHPDIIEFIKMRTPSGGDANRKIVNRSGVHHGVNFNKKFAQAVIDGTMFDLVCPHTNEIRETVPARLIWETWLQARELTGEPYFYNIDNTNEQLNAYQKAKGLRNHGSNLCVAPETLVLTDEGYVQICTLEGERVNVWNGKEFSNVEVVKTGENQKLVKVVTNSGFELDCTPYHKFYVAVRGSDGTKILEKRAHELREGDKLVKCDFPIINGNHALENAYENGLFSAEGCYTPQGKRIYLYHEKRNLRKHLSDIFGKWTVQDNLKREYAHSVHLKDKFFVPMDDFSVDSKVRWFAGLCDGDGTVARCGETQAIQVGSVNKNFLLETQLMLQTIGVSSKVTQMHEAGVRQMPLNDGTGNLGGFNCQASYRLLIGQTGIVTLQNLGFKTHRLVLTNHQPNRECAQFVKVVAILDEGRVDDTYCFTEPKRHMGVFNGIITGQCSEITLANNDERTAICCLSSLNLEKYDEWKDTELVQDLIRYLDNILQWFIDWSPEELSRAAFSAEQERAVGLGGMGWANLLLHRGIGFESNEALQLNKEVWKLIKERAVESTKQLAKERGEPNDLIGSGTRNSHLLAIAPNANSSILCGTSPSIEPLMSNAYTQKTRAGIMLVKNKYLVPVLDRLGINTEATWMQIVASNGSVQWIEGLSEQEKQVFKTAWEVDQHVIIQQAEDRQKYVCQAQSLNVFFLPGSDKSYINSVHLKALVSDVLKSMYYFRTGSAVAVQNVQEQARVALQDFKVEDKPDEDCVACQA